jgi:Fe-S oxidoreductase
MAEKNLNKWQEEMNICIRCAYCFEGCPVFQLTKWESDSARGKTILAYGLLTGELEPSKYIAEKLFQCTYCRDCSERCSADVSIVDVIAAARADLVEAGFATDIHTGMVKNVKETGNIFGDKDIKAPVQEGSMPVFIGCQYLARPNQTKMYLKILEKLGVKPLVKDEMCCGYPLYALGFRKEFAEHRKKFLEMFPEKDIIALCPTCAAYIHEEYGKNVKHITQAILEHIPEKNLGLKATYHDPCDLSRVMGITEEPRAILKKIGIEVIEMARNRKTSHCCGGGGGILMSDVNLSDDIALVRIKQAIATGAPLLITPCPTCEQVLKKAAATVKEKGNGSITVKNLSDVVWQALRS